MFQKITSSAHNLILYCLVVTAPIAHYGQKPQKQCINEKNDFFCFCYFYDLLHFKASYIRAVSKHQGAWKQHLKQKNWQFKKVL